MSLTTNLVSYWKLDESSGNAADSVGSETLTNTNVTYGAGIINNGAVFNGTNAKLASPSDSNLTVGSNFSLSMWVKPSQPAFNNSFYQRPGSGGENLSIGQNGTTTGGVWYARFSHGGSFTNSIVSSSAGLTYGTWYHLVVTFNNNVIQLYTSGATSGSLTPGAVTPDGGAAVSQLGQFGSGDFGKGTFDEVGIWSRALSGAEVTQLYNGGAGLQYPFTTTAPANPSFLLKMI